MKISYKLLDVLLNLFDGGAGGGAAGASAGAAAPAGDTASGDQGGSDTRPSTTRKAGKKGDLSNVVYGKQPNEQQPDTKDNKSSDAGNNGNPGVKVTSDTLEAKRAEWQNLISGDYKDFYTQDTQNIINKRFKETKAYEEQISKYTPVIETQMQKYGVSDIESLNDAIKKDTELWINLAVEAGFNGDADGVAKYQNYLGMERENKQLKQIQAQQAERQKEQQYVSRIVKEAEAFKAKMPTFDLIKESKDPTFAALTHVKGVTVEHAYNLIHMDEIMQEVASNSSKQTEKKIVDNVRAQGTRPAENGAAPSSNSAVIYKTDVSKYTKEDRKEIARRVRMGEM